MSFGGTKSSYLFTRFCTVFSENSSVTLITTVLFVFDRYPLLVFSKSEASTHLTSIESFGTYSFSPASTQPSNCCGMLAVCDNFVITVEDLVSNGYYMADDVEGNVVDPNFKGYNVINCASFQELLDAQKVLNKPIIYNEYIKNQKSMFIIINDKDVYRYILKEADLYYYNND